MRRPWSAALEADLIPSKKPAQPQFYIPSVILPAKATKSNSGHKIHILGHDERSKFIAHALSSVYDSVELLGAKKTSAKYLNFTRRSLYRESTLPTPIKAGRGNLDDNKASHIDRAIVTGHGRDAVKAIEAIKDRVDENTTICLMNDGLGVLEHVRRKIFQGTEVSPNFMLGYMSHKLVFNRNTNSVRQLMPGATYVTPVELFRTQNGMQHRTEQRSDFVQSLLDVKDLRTNSSTFDDWLRFKLPSVIFESVVEPVCTVLDLTYEGILGNPAARSMMHRLIQEIVEVVDNLPELEGLSTTRHYIRSHRFTQILFRQLNAKKSNPSRMAQGIGRGANTDIEYMNGYFIRRARQLGMTLKMNSLVKDIISAKQFTERARRNSDVPIEETSIPSEESSRYSTAARVHRGMGVLTTKVHN